jgi:hypothetical protein
MSKLTVFIACPYSIFPLDDYKAIFNRVARAYSVSFSFADAQITNQHILDKVTQLIRNSDLSLFDITGWNPNVALELGLAVGMAKKYYILFNTEYEAKDAPTDLRGLDRIQYASNTELEARLNFLMKQEIPADPGTADTAFSTMKERILVTLRTTPGLGLARTAETLTEDKRLVQSVIRAMVDSGELRTRGQKKGTVYYTGDTDLRKVPRR